MLALRAGWMTAAPLAVTSGYSKRNVHDALVSLSDAAVISVARAGGGELRYRIDPLRWASLLGCSERELPGHLEWGAIFGALRVILRWARSATVEGTSEYMQASQARQLLDDLAPRLGFAGIVTVAPTGVDDAMEALRATVRRSLDACGAFSATPQLS